MMQRFPLWGESRAVIASQASSRLHVQSAELSRDAGSWRDVGCLVNNPRAFDLSRYFAHISSRRPVKHGDVPSAIGVLESLDTFMPIADATCRDRDADWLAVLTLRIGKQELRGHSIIQDREFKPIDCATFLASRRRSIAAQIRVWLLIELMGESRE
jgi:hypothetical protein